MNDTQEYIDHPVHQWQLAQTDNTAQWASSHGTVLFICHCGAYKDIDIWPAPTEGYQLTSLAPSHTISIKEEDNE